VLPAGSRLRRRADVTDTVRAGRGVRANDLLVVHVRCARSGSPRAGLPPRAGLVVSRSIGSAVVRNTVKRRLRHLLASRLADLPPGTDVVVRALPAAATATSARLGEALDRALDRALDWALDRALDRAVPGGRRTDPRSGNR